MSPHSTLSESERVSLEIGRIARADTSLEYQLRDLFFVLVGGNRTVATLCPTRFEELSNSCKSLIQASETLPAADIELCVKTIQRAKDAHQQRNRATHDSWIVDDVDEATWFSLRHPLERKRGPEIVWSIEDFTEVFRQLNAAYHGIWGLIAFVEQARLTPEERDSHADRFEQLWRDLLAGNFETTESGAANVMIQDASYRLTGALG